MDVTVLQLWLSRAKQAPISLTCNPMCLNLDQHQILSPHGGNIKSLNHIIPVDGVSSLSGTHAKFFESLFLPSLEQLSVASRLVDPITFKAKNTYLTHTTPLLREEDQAVILLELAHLTLKCAYLAIPFDFPSLQVLDLESLTLSHPLFYRY